MTQHIVLAYDDFGSHWKVGNDLFGAASLHLATNCNNHFSPLSLNVPIKRLGPSTDEAQPFELYSSLGFAEISSERFSFSTRLFAKSGVDICFQTWVGDLEEKTRKANWIFSCLTLQGEKIETKHDSQQVK